MVRLAAVLLLLAFGLAPATARTIYWWVDAQGRTHLADSVPDRYRASARRIESGAYELSDAQRAAAQARAARDRAALRSAPAPGAAVAPVPAAPAPLVARSRPRIGEGECDRLWREFFESQACYAPFRTSNFGIKAEAVDYCGEPLLNPSLRCGPPRTEAGI